MSLYGLLAVYEADLAAVNEAITLINELAAKIVNLSAVTKETIEVDGLPYKQEMLDDAGKHAENALDYLSSTVVPTLNKKIASTKEQIKAFEEAQKKEKESDENS